MTGPRPVFIAGPTAVGKSELALRVAEAVGGEIVSVDSMQVYKGMDIGTAKPLAADRARVPHHLIDIADLAEGYDAARFVHDARTAVTDIQSRGKIPVFCGGTGLYFQALHGLSDSPRPDPALRRELEQTPLPVLLEELQRTDPLTHQRIDRQNPRRVIRAVEVTRLSGRPFSQHQADWSAAPPPGCYLLLLRGLDDLRRRIDLRVDRMFRLGLVEETQRLLESGLRENRTAMQALGYRQVVEHLAGAIRLDQASALVKTRTRQFAKRQLTWFRRYFPGIPVELAPEPSAEASAAGLIDLIRADTSRA